MAAMVLALCATAPALATEFIVDQAHAKADDANAGSAEAPLKTIAKGVSLAKAGDTVIVKAGTYGEAVTITAGGEAGKPITIKAAPGERVVLTGAKRCGITWAAGVGYLVIDGFEFRDAGVFGNDFAVGSEGEGGHHVTIQNCVAVGCAMQLSKQSDCTIRRSIQTGSKRNGINLVGCKNCTVEECEIYDNGADGITVSWGSDGCKVLRNYVHHMWYDSHPDGIQVYRKVTNFTVEGNLFFNVGQGFMLEETDGGVFRNNILAGTRHSGLVLGHKNTHNWTVEQNTIAYTSFKAIIFSGQNTVIRNNVVLCGGDNKLIQQAGQDPASGDYNLLWKPEGVDVIYHMPKDQTPHSKFADPKFRSAPPLNQKAIFYIDVWANKGSDKLCTPSKLYLGGRPLTNHFKVGDHIEVDFDGRVRKVTEVTNEYIVFEPPIEKVHHIAWNAVVNWKDRKEFVWDLRLAEGSPGKGLGDKGQDVGSNIDMQAYMKGDFNGDGQRDLPPAPKK